MGGEVKFWKPGGQGRNGEPGILCRMKKDKLPAGWMRRCKKISVLDWKILAAVLAMAAQEGNCRRSEILPGQGLSRRGLRRTHVKTEQTDQSGLGCNETNCQLLGCKHFLAPIQASQVRSSPRQQPPHFAFLLQLVQTDLVM